jgi:HD-like signal output (HDOD) protein
VLAQDLNFRIEEFAASASLDPVITLELFKVANSVSIGGGKPPVTSIQMAVTRLGSGALLQVLNGISFKAPNDNSKWLELNRLRGQRIAKISKLLSELFARTNVQEAELAGLFCCLGDLLAATYLGSVYDKLADSYPRAATQYRLVQEHKFDPDKLGPEYLLRSGIPITLVIQVENDQAAKDKRRVLIKPLILTAIELVDAFEKGRLEKLSPKQTLPAMSNIRLLHFQGDQYEKFYESASMYLSASATH